MESDRRSEAFEGVRCVAQERHAFKSWCIVASRRKKKAERGSTGERRGARRGGGKEEEDSGEKRFIHDEGGSGERKKEILTSYVRSAAKYRMDPVDGNHHNFGCSALSTSASKFSIASSNFITCRRSLKRKARSTLRVTATMKPVAPNPHRLAWNRSRFCVSEQCKVWPVGSMMSRARTWVGMTPKWMPVPCVAVVTMPAIVWSEMEPRLDIARPCCAKTWWRTCKLIPPSTTTYSFSVFT